MIETNAPRTVVQVYANAPCSGIKDDCAKELMEALDSILELCELHGMHDDKTYQRCKAVCAKAMRQRV